MLIAFACVLHFALGATVGLSVDEAHYALYARHLALSYFDHPPLVGWIQWPLVALDLPTAALRLLPEALWLGTALGVHHIAMQLQGSDASDPASNAAGFWAVLALALSPLIHVLGIGLLPDTLLMFFAVALMALTLRLMQPDALQRSGLWALLGLLLGVAGLSKYTAIFFAFAVGGCLLLAHGLALLTRRGLWWSIGIALVLVLPVAVWNYQNDWISFTYQAKHGAGGQWEWPSMVRFLVVQLFAFGPLLLWGWVRARSDSSGKRALRLFFVIPFCVLAAMAGGGTSLPHWTTPAWVTLAPFAGVALARAVQSGKSIGIAVLVLAQALACTALLGLMVSAGVPFTSGTSGRGDTTQPSNPFADLFGWDVAGQRASAIAAEHGLHSVAVQNWTLASRLGWYARPLPVFVLQDRFDQFDLWAGDLPSGGATLLVDWSQLAYEIPVGEHGFASCKLLEQHAVRRFGVPIANFGFYACKGWSGSPRPRLLGARP
jgi:4-amino-4-deoxy-L-arabinose transferase-like glycosyltransferase